MLQIDSTRCTGCGACARDCFTRAITLKDGVPTLSGRCIMCGHCVAVCPTEAVSLAADGYDMAEVRQVTRARISPDALLACMTERRSVRQFLPDAVEEAALQKIIQAGRVCPTASNLQSNALIVVQEQIPALRLRAMASLAALGDRILQSPNDFPAVVQFYAKQWTRGYAAFTMHPDAAPDWLFFRAPLVLIVASDSAIDAPLAASKMELMANALGLGVLYSGFLVRAIQADEALQAFLRIPAPKQAQVAMVLGTPAVEYHRTVPRKAANVVRL